MIPHAAGQLNLCTTTAKPVLQDPRAATAEALALQSQCSATREASAMRSLQSPHLEKAFAQQQRPSSQKKKLIIKVI